MVDQETARILSAALGNQIRFTRDAAEAQFGAGVVVQVATLRLLIQSGITTTEAAIEQIEAVRGEFPDVFQREDVATRTQWAIDCLRGKTPLHGSIADQAGQRAERERRAKPDSPDTVAPSPQRKYRRRPEKRGTPMSA